MDTATRSFGLVSGLTTGVRRRRFRPRNVSALRCGSFAGSLACFPLDARVFGPVSRREEGRAQPGVKCLASGANRRERGSAAGHVSLRSASGAVSQAGRHGEGDLRRTD